jgi:hypothetical protein
MLRHTRFARFRQFRNPFIQRTIAALIVVVLLLAPAGAVSAATGSVWSIVRSPNPQTSSVSNDVLWGVSALADDDVWAVGYSNSSNSGVINRTLAEHWKGTAWSIVPTPNVGSNGSSLAGVSALTPTDVWAVGNFNLGTQTNNGRTLIEHFDGNAWSVVPSPNLGNGGDFLTGVAAIAADDVWAVGWFDNQTVGFLGPLIEHWNGTAWSVVTAGVPLSSGIILESITAISATDIWTVGQQAGGSATNELHWNGTKWTVMPTAPFPNGGQEMLRGVSAAGTNDVWAVGSYAPTVFAELQTLAVHWDGTEWTRVTTPNVDVYFNLLYSVAAVNSHDVWAVGYAYTPDGLDFHTLVEHWDGQQWTISPSPNIPNPYGRGDMLTGIVRSGATSLWAVGTFLSTVQGNPGIRTLTEHALQG